MRFYLCLAALMLAVGPSTLYAGGRAQAAQNPIGGGGQPPAASSEGATLCGQQVPPPVSLPPAGSPPVLWVMGPCFEAQGNVSLVDIQT